MADSEVIRSFLVSVGVDADEQGIRKFDKTVEGVTKTVTAFAVAMGAAAAATAAAAVKISDQFEGMFYASQRLRSSIVNMKAFSFGISQMGGDAKAAMNSLEGFASFMRSSPASEGWIKGMLGVNMRDASGNVRDYADALGDVGERLSNMPYWRAQQMAETLGIDESTLQAMRRDPRLWRERARDAMAATGSDFDAMAEKSVAAMQKIRMLRLQLELLAYRVLDAVDPRVLELTVKIAVGAAAFALLGLAIGPVATSIIGVTGALGLLIDDFNTWRKGGDTLIDWEKWSPQIDKAIIGFKSLGDGLAGVGSALKDFAHWWNEAFGLKSETLLKQFVDDISGAIWSLGEALKAVEAIMRLDFKAAMTHAANAMDTRRMPSGHASAEQRRNALSGANDNTPAGRNAAQIAVDYFKRQGWTDSQARGIVAGLHSESLLNPDAINPQSGAEGIAQWLSKDRIANFERVMGKSIADADFMEQLRFVQWELMNTEGRARQNIRGSRTAAQALNSFVYDYERPGPVDSPKNIQRGMNFLNGPALGASGARNVTINSSTEIKINGAADPAGVGRHVGAVIDRRNAELTRNTQAAVK